MTEQEKELVSFLYTLPEEKDGYGGSQLNCEEAAKALTQRYPQILAEKVGDWDYELTKRGSRKYYFFTENPVESIFIREVVS